MAKLERFVHMMKYLVLSGTEVIGGTKNRLSHLLISSINKYNSRKFMILEY